MVPGETVQLDERAYRTELEGGPLVLSELVPGVRSAAVGIWIRWGASHDRDEEMGAAHLLEHMVFKGTENRSAREIALGIEGIGGALDAYTSREHTAVHARVLDEHLPIAVEILTDLVFRPLLLENDLELERNVVLEEIAGVEDTPEELIFDLNARSLWGSHPYGNPVLGTRDTVGAITRDDMLGLWRRAYQANTCVIAAAGNVHHEKLLDLVMRNFPSDAGVGVAPNLQTPPAVQPSRNSQEREGSQVHVCMSATTFPRSDPRRYASILVSTALGGGMSSRLFQRVREELGLVYTIYSFQSFYAQAGLAGLYMATRRDTSEQAVEVVLGELGNLAVSALPGGELQAVKNQTKGQVVLSLESTSARLQRLASTALYDEPYLTLDEICQRIDAVTENEVSEICGQYYAPERHTIVRLGPTADSLD